MNQDLNSVTEDFYRHNYSRTVAILTRYFGLGHLDVAEDIVQDTLLEAMDKWKGENIPDNPEGWIMDVASKKAINFLRRKKLFREKIAPDLNQGDEVSEVLASDSTLKMIFACCHPDLPPESQIALSLKTLCGLSVAEVSKALLTTEANVNKRLYRARQKFREGKVAFAIPADSEREERIAIVCRTLYLLFNEGCYPSNSGDIIRIDLCYESIRLLQEVRCAFPGSTRVNALLALMLFNLSRCHSRVDEQDAVICLQDQDRSLWDGDLIMQAMEYLSEATVGNDLNLYQLQAGIAAEHCLAPCFSDTNWGRIYKLYELMAVIDRSFPVKMNKYLALFYRGSRHDALAALQELQHAPDFRESSTYYLTLGTLCLENEQLECARTNLTKAFSLALTEKERRVIQTRLNLLDSI